MVKAAYEKTQLYPTVEGWGHEDQGTACPIAALCVASGHGHPSEWTETGEDFYIKLAGILSLSREYIMGFVNGFDLYSVADNTPSYRNGRQDGEQVRRNLSL